MWLAVEIVYMIVMEVLVLIILINIKYKKIFITVNELIYFRCREYIVIN